MLICVSILYLHIDAYKLLRLVTVIVKQIRILNITSGFLLYFKSNQTFIVVGK